MYQILVEHEEGIFELCEMLIERGVGIKVGLLSLDDTRVVVRSGLADCYVRVLIEPLDSAPESAVAQAVSMEDVLCTAGILLERVHHGDGVASWAVSERALCITS